MTTSRPWWTAGTNTPDTNPDRVHRRSARNIITGITIALALAGGLTAILTNEPPKTQLLASGATAHQQSMDALIGGCGPIYTFPATQATGATVPANWADGTPNYQNYLATDGVVVPIFGKFWPTPAPASTRFYGPGTGPAPEALLNNMWHGQMIVYYATDADPSDIVKLRQVAATETNLDLIVTPWPARLGPMPMGRKIAYAAWGASQTCYRFVAPALGDFRDATPAHNAPSATGATPTITTATR